MREMSRRRLVKAYLRDRAWLVLLIVSCGLILYVVTALYQLNMEALGYGGLLCLLPLSLAAWVDYLRYAAHHQALARLLPGLPESISHLPETSGLVQQDYQAALKALYQQHKQQVTQADARSQALAHYYTLWSHQIKTPLAAMRLLLQEDTAHDRKLLGELFKVNQYVNMALGYARLDSQASDFVFSRLKLASPVSQTARRFAAQFVAKRLSLNLSVPEEASAVTDEKWLCFLLEQLLSNAIKYTQAGGVSISWEEGQKELIIQDTGMGIMPEDLPRVFEMGFTGYNGRVDQQATGIGLFLARETAQRLGLTLRLDSKPGQGTRAVIGFPRETLMVE